MAQIAPPQTIAQSAYLLANATKQDIIERAGRLGAILEPIFNQIDYKKLRGVWEEVGKELLFIPLNSEYNLVELRLKLRAEYNNLLYIAQNDGSGQYGRARRFATAVAKHFSPQT